VTNFTFEQLCELFCYTPKGRPLDPKEAADILSLSVDTLEGYRTRGVPLRYFSPLGTRIVRYAERDLLEWLACGARYSTSEQMTDHEVRRGSTPHA
jgi:Helix-turn-helix domain